MPSSSFLCLLFVFARGALAIAPIWQAWAAAGTFSGLDGPSAALDWTSAGRVTFLYGGAYDSTTLFAVNASSKGLSAFQLKPNPGPRRLHCSAVLDDGTLLVFGGLSMSSAQRSSVSLGDVWQFDNRTRAWTMLATASDSPAPTPRFSSACFSRRASLYVYGGAATPDISSFQSDLWRFDVPRRRWTRLSAVSGLLVDGTGEGSSSSSSAGLLLAPMAMPSLAGHGALYLPGSLDAALVFGGIQAKRSPSSTGFMGSGGSGNSWTPTIVSSLFLLTFPSSDSSSSSNNVVGVFALGNVVEGPQPARASFGSLTLLPSIGGACVYGGSVELMTTGGGGGKLAAEVNCLDLTPLEGIVGEAAQEQARASAASKVRRLRDGLGERAMVAQSPFPGAPAPASATPSPKPARRSMQWRQLKKFGPGSDAGPGARERHGSMGASSSLSMSVASSQQPLLSPSLWSQDALIVLGGADRTTFGYSDSWVVGPLPALAPKEAVLDLARALLRPRNSTTLLTAADVQSFVYVSPADSDGAWGEVDVSRGPSLLFIISGVIAGLGTILLFVSCVLFSSTRLSTCLKTCCSDPPHTSAADSSDGSRGFEGRGLHSAALQASIGGRPQGLSKELIAALPGLVFHSKQKRGKSKQKLKQPGKDGKGTARQSQQQATVAVGKGPAAAKAPSTAGIIDTATGTAPAAVTPASGSSSNSKLSAASPTATNAAVDSASSVAEEAQVHVEVEMRSALAKAEEGPASRGGGDTAIDSDEDDAEGGPAGVQPAGPSDADADADAEGQAGAEADACGICLFPFEDGQSLTIMPSCLHRFHAECSAMWLTESRRCALCRADVLVGLQAGAAELGGPAAVISIITA